MNYSLFCKYVPGLYGAVKPKVSKSVFLSTDYNITI